MIEYPHTTPLVLTDELFKKFGGDTDLGKNAQRQAAYHIAEMYMTQHIGTFLTPTSVTGVWDFAYYTPERILLSHDRLRSIDAVTILSKKTTYDCTIQEINGCAFITDATIGIIDVRLLQNICNCFSYDPYSIRIAYTAGLTTGTAAIDTRLHLALTMAAKNTLWEILDPGALEGGPGDPGVQEYINMGYAEVRTKLKDTTFGPSATSNKIANLVEHLKIHTALKLGY